MLLISHIPIWKFIQNNHHSQYTDIRLLFFDWIHHRQQSLCIAKKVYCFVYTQIPHEKCIAFWWLIWCRWIYRMFGNRMNFSCFLSYDIFSLVHLGVMFGRFLCWNISLFRFVLLLFSVFDTIVYDSRCCISNGNRIRVLFFVSTLN